MNNQEILGAIGIALIVVGGIWGAFKILLLRDRKSVDDRAKADADANELARKELWDEINNLRDKVEGIKLDQATLKEQVRHLPDHDALRERFEAMDERLEKRLEKVVQQLQEAFTVATSRFRCPYDHEERGKT